MTPYAKAARRKGWTMRDLAARWDVSPRTLSRTAANPTQRDVDALAGLPDRYDADGVTARAEELRNELEYLTAEAQRLGVDIKE